MSRVTNEAFVTLATTDNYAIGALTLAQSLRNVNTNRQLCILVTKDITESLRRVINDVFDHVEVVEDVESGERPELANVFRKLYCWKLVQYRKCVFLDADCFVLKNVDELFDRDEMSASPDVGWPDCFNSGVFVYRPSLDTHSSLLSFGLNTTNYDGTDQGLLNLYFKNWNISDASKRLPFLYNMTTNVSYSYAPAFKQFNEQVKVVHFMGTQKPWYYTYNTETQRVTGNVVQHETMYVNQWWKLFSDRVYPLLGEDVKDRLKTQYVQSRQSGTSVQYPNQNMQQTGSNEMNFSNFFDSSHGYPQQPQVVIGSNNHQILWEQGQIDYTGRDAFDNIKAHLDSQLKDKK